MFTFLTILIIVVCLFIVMIVLIQNPKGGGLTGGMGNTASSIIGVQSAGDVMEKTTWGSALLLMLLCVLTAFIVPRDDNAGVIERTKTEEAAKLPSTAPVAQPTAPAVQQPQTQQQQPANNPLAPTK